MWDVVQICRVYANTRTELAVSMVSFVNLRANETPMGNYPQYTDMLSTTKSKQNEVQPQE